MAIQADALATVYARSLYDLASEAGGAEKIAEIGDELTQIGELARDDRDFREFLVSPIIDSQKRGGALQKILQDRVSDLTLRFMLVLNTKGRLPHFQSIADAYDQMLQEAYGRVEVDLFTANALGDEQRAVIADRIKAAIGKEPVLHAYTEPEMIGGIKLRIGDQMIDGSVATKLRRMRHELLASGATSEATRFIEENGA